MQAHCHIFTPFCVIFKEVVIGGKNMIILRPKFFGVVFGVILSVAVVAQGLLTDNSKAIKKVPTTHKVVAL